MIRHSKAIVAAALVALSFALMGAGNLPANPSTAVTIFNPGDANFTGYAIAVEPSGQAWTMDGAGRSQSLLPNALTQAFFTDLAAAGPLAQLAARPCTSDHPNLGIYLVWRGQHSPNLQCASDPRADRLLADATTIARALYVQAYRLRPVGLYSAQASGSAGGYQSSYQPSQPSAAAASSYANAGGGYATGANCTCGGYATSATASNPPGSYGYSFGLSGGIGAVNNFSAGPNSGFSSDFAHTFSAGSFNAQLPVNNSVFSNRSAFSSGFNGSQLSNGTSTTFSSQPISGFGSSSMPTSTFNFH